MIDWSNYEVDGQMSIFDLDTWSGKMSPEHSAATEEKISDVSLKKQQELPTVTPQFLDFRTDRPGAILGVFWETDGLSLGGYMTHSFGESPKEDVESHLSQILEDNPLPKYYLSATACQGILRRADRRGKELPEILKDALMKQSAFKKDAENLGGARESSFSGTEQERYQRLTINPSSTDAEKSGGCNDQTVYCLQGNGIGRADNAGCNGRGWREDQSYTLNTIDRPAVMTMQAIGDYKIGGVASSLKERDHKDATDLVIQ